MSLPNIVLTSNFAQGTLDLTAVGNRIAVQMASEQFTRAEIAGLTGSGATVVVEASDTGETWSAATLANEVTSAISTVLQADARLKVTTGTARYLQFRVTAVGTKAATVTSLGGSTPQYVQIIGDLPVGGAAASIATTTKPGIVKPDGKIITVSSAGLIASPFLNFIAERTVYRNGPEGLLGNGSSTPIRTAFSSSGTTDDARLQAAKAMFPHVTSLDDEFEWAVVQDKIDKLAAGFGGLVQFGDGVFVSNGKSIFKRSGVSLAGANLAKTVFKRLDAGTVGDCIIYCDNRDVGPNDGFLRDFAVATTSQYQTLGTLPSNIDGIQLAAHVKVSDVSGFGCRRFISLKGDHNQLFNIRGKGNGFAIYFDDPPPAIFGNLTLIGIETDYSTIAVIGVHPRANITSVFIVGGSSALDTSPFAFYKEIDPNMSGGNSILFYDLIMDNVQMEQLGNAAISGGAPLTGPSSVQGSNRPELHNLDMRKCQFSYGGADAFKVAGWSRDYLFDVTIAEGWTINGIAANHLSNPGEKGMFCIRQPTSISIRGDVEGLLTNCANAGKDFFTIDPATPTGPDGGMSVTLDHQGIWQGEVVQGYSVAKGDLISGTAGCGQAVSTTSSIDPLGVAMSGAGFATGVAVARQGKVAYVNYDTDVAGSASNRLYSGPNGGKVTAVLGGRYVGTKIGAHGLRFDRSPIELAGIPRWTTPGRPVVPTGSVVIGFNTDLRLMEVGVGNGSATQWGPMSSAIASGRPSMTLTNAAFETGAPIGGNASLKGGVGTGTATVAIPAQSGDANASAVAHYFRFQSKGGATVAAGAPFLQFVSPNNGPTIDVGFSGNNLTVGFGGSTTNLGNVRDGAIHEIEVAWNMYAGLCFVYAFLDGNRTTIAENSGAGNLAPGNSTLLYTGSRLAAGDLLDSIELASGDHTNDSAKRPVPVTVKSDTLMLLQFDAQNGNSS